MGNRVGTSPRAGWHDARSTPSPVRRRRLPTVPVVAAGVAVVTGGLAHGGVVRAEEPPLRVVVEGPSACADGLVRELARRVSPRGVERAGTEARGVVVLRLAAPDAEGRVVGRLERADDGTARVVEGRTCEEVARALALAVAVAEPVEPDAPTPARVPAPAPVEGAPARDAVRRATPRGTREGTAAAVAFGLALGVDGTTLTPSPTIAPTVATFLGLEPARGVFAPRLRLRGAATLATQVDARSGDARLSFLTAGLDACPVRARLGPVDARPCLGLDVGALTAEGIARGDAPAALARRSRRTRPWVAARATLGAEIAVGGPLAATIEGGLLLPATRDAFVFAPSEHVYRPAPALVGAVGLVARWP